MAHQGPRLVGPKSFGNVKEVAMFVVYCDTVKALEATSASFARRKPWGMVPKNTHEGSEALRVKGEAMLASFPLGDEAFFLNARSKAKCPRLVTHIAIYTRTSLTSSSVGHTWKQRLIIQLFEKCVIFVFPNVSCSPMACSICRSHFVQVMLK